MAKLNIQTGTDNKILRTRSERIKKVDKKIIRLVDNMRETLLLENGLGLAAPQVGENIRVILARLNFDTPQEMVKPLINPEIILTSDETVVAEEGCLSLPDCYKPVERFKKIRVRFDDIRGEGHILELEDLNARIVQHEVDHLNGMLFIDRVDEDAMLVSEKGTGHPKGM
ncbi:peptide deformylase [Candidatus Peregrinibacteria bacterium]|nr:peptide deformylase [Candidatus Peregrinibacteria bacterium]